MTSLTVPSSAPILVTAGNGKTGRRIARRLTDAGYCVRAGSRSSTPPFDWNDANTWSAALDNVKAAYIAFTPDLALPGAVTIVEAFCAQAVRHGVRRLVLLAGRGEDEAVAAENVVKAAGVPWTIIRASWFNQNFSEDYLLGPVLAGRIELPAADVVEPFVDADDIAEVAVSALTDARHDGRTYDVTGPHLLRFSDVARTLSIVACRPITYVSVSTADYVKGLVAQGIPDEFAHQLGTLFSVILDGRNAHLGNGVFEALGREPNSFDAYARVAAKTGVWNVNAESNQS